ARAFLPETARGEAGADPGLALTGIGGLADLVADIAQRGKRRGAPELSALSGGVETGPPPGKRAQL
ncbi:MAG TPA: hypothetical protein VE909_00220, partial [Xanthobacteraceae bacterium]|nr:hypothetical protein [Xanthobacteraceae bacterium]